MPERLNDILQVSKNALDEQNIFNSFIDLDILFYVDPHLLQACELPEIKEAYKTFENYFEDLIRILEACNEVGDPFFREAARKLRFKELKFLTLGYSSGGIQGSGIGKKLAKNLTGTALKLVKEGIKDVKLFELIGLLEEGVGADRISDMTTQIIHKNLLDFTQRKAQELNLNIKSYSYGDKEYELPFVPSNNHPLYLLPKDILRHLPVAHDWEDIDYVCAHNRLLRNKVNGIIGNTWKEATKEKKSKLKRIVMSNPEVFEDLLRQYKNKPATSYDFNKDPTGQIIWHEKAVEFAEEYPFSLDNIDSKKKLLSFSKEMCEHFANLVEYNGLNRVLYDDQKNLRHEKIAQLLFYGIADAFCRANNIDLSREPNAGRGPVDFKLSKGFSIKVNIEVKFTSNRHLYRGYTTQLPIYNKQENTDLSIYLILETSDTSSVIERIIEKNNKERTSGKKVPEVIIADARLKPSASKA